MSVNPLLKKLIDIKFLYGESAKLYFLNKPFCENCNENRIACLSIHHVEGKTKQIYKTLCNNCHSLEHSKNPNYTYKKYLNEIEKIKYSKTQIKNKIIVFRKKGWSLRKIARNLNISHTTVKNYIGK